MSSMKRPESCQVCGRSQRKDGEPLEIQICNRCGPHSGKWLCLSCYLKWTEHERRAEAR